MKRCPHCNRVETDESLKFCRIDGVTLVSDYSSLSAGEIASSSSSSEIETSILPHKTDADISRETARTTVLPPQPAASPTVELSKPSRRKVVSIVAILITVATTISIVIAGYFYTSRKTTAAIDSIAVLPFVNVSGDPNTEYLSDGITESIINSLSQLPNLGVIARNSVFTYKGKHTDAPTVGRELNVRSVLTGRTMQRGDNLSISVELVDTTNNHQLWGQQYNRKLADVFALQEEIAKEISERLRVKLTGAERQQLAKRPTENLKAFQYYMQGRAYIERRTRGDLLMAIQYYEKALQEDPKYALAYAGVADAYDNLGARSYIAPAEGRRKADDAARKALALDDTLAEAHAVLGEVYTDFAPYNFPEADRELRRAIELGPNLALGHQHLGGSLARQGRLDESLAEYLKARELDPLSSAIARQQALPYYLKRDYARALELLRHANELGPAFSVSWEIGPYIQTHSFSEALNELNKAGQDRKDDPVLIHFIGMIYAAQGKKVEAFHIVKELEMKSGENLAQAYFIAKICATLNEKDLAFSWLERGLNAAAITVFYKDEPVWDSLRADPRFSDMLRRMGIP